MTEGHFHPRIARGGGGGHQINIIVMYSNIYQVGFVPLVELCNGSNDEVIPLLLSVFV